MVTSSKGPEAGVWVIAETTDLPTKFVKIVVTDDQGRYLVPELPKANYRRVGSRLRAGGFAESESRTGQDPEPEGGRGAGQEGCRRILSRAVLVLFAAGAAQERFPRHGADRERYCHEHQEPGRMDSRHRQHGRLHGLSSDGRQGHARDSQEYPQSDRRHRKPRGIAGFRQARRAAG